MNIETSYISNVCLKSITTKLNHRLTSLIRVILHFPVADVIRKGLNVGSTFRITLEVRLQSRLLGY